MAKTFVAFIFGAAAGSVATYFAVKSKFAAESEAYINEEIDLMKQHYSEKLSEYEPKSEKPLNEAKNGQKQAKSEWSEKKFETPEEEKAYYDGIINKLNYNSITRKKDEPKTEETTPKKIVPVVVTSDEVVDLDMRSKEHLNYDTMHVIFFEGDEVHDSVVIDEFTEEIIEDGIELIGRDNLSSFSSEIDNMTYIRNDLRGTYIEVTFDERNYEDTEYFED